MTATHRCPVRGCSETGITPDLLMCRADWYRVPRAIRSAVNRAYRGYLDGSTTIAELRHVQNVAIEAATGRRAGT